VVPELPRAGDAVIGLAVLLLAAIVLIVAF
jgi:hypothetical protein